MIELSRDQSWACQGGELGISVSFKQGGGWVSDRVTPWS